MQPDGRADLHRSASSIHVLAIHDFGCAQWFQCSIGHGNAVTVKTAGASASVRHDFPGASSRVAPCLALFGLSGLVLLGGKVGRFQGRGPMFRRLAFLCILVPGLTWVRCGGGGVQREAAGAERQRERTIFR